MSEKEAVGAIAVSFQVVLAYHPDPSVNQPELSFPQSPYHRELLMMLLIQAGRERVM